MASEKLAQVREVLSNWQDKTRAILLNEIKKQGIGVTGELYDTLSHELDQRGAGYFNLILHMKLRGRMVDMGVGRGVPIERVKLERYKSRGAKRKRRPKKWYSKVFYGRLNDLQGAVGYKMMEEANQIVTSAVKII